MPFKNRPHLTIKTINDLSPSIDGKRVEVGDGRVPGLYLRVTARGLKSFSFVYRARGGPQRRITLGRWPEARDVQKAALDGFRSRAQALAGEVAVGGDPVAEARERAKVARKDRKFAWLVDDYIQNEAKPAIKTWRQAEAVLRRYWVPALGETSLPAVSRTALYEVLQRIVADGRIGAAENARKHISRVFSYAVDRGYLEMSPAQRLRVSAIDKHRSRARALSEDEIVAVWNATGRLEQPWRAALRVLLLTGARRTEVTEARRSDLTSDGWLQIGADRYKTGREHSYWLSRAARMEISSLPLWFPPDRSFVFSVRAGSSPIRGMARTKQSLDELASEFLGHEIAPFRIHDFRVTVRTELARLGVSNSVAESVIGHAKRGVERIYDQHDYRSERRDALDAWEHRLRGLVDVERSTLRA